MVTIGFAAFVIIAIVVIVFVLIPLLVIFKGRKDIHIDDGSEVSLGQEDKFIIIEDVNKENDIE